MKQPQSMDETSSTQQKFATFEQEIAERTRESEDAMEEEEDIETGKQAASLPTRIISTLVVLFAAFLLYRLPGRFPPPAWVDLVHVARREQVYTSGEVLLTVLHALLLLGAWILLLFLALRVVRLWLGGTRVQPDQDSKESWEALGVGVNKQDEALQHDDGPQGVRTDTIVVSAPLGEDSSSRGAVSAGRNSGGDGARVSLCALVIDSSTRGRLPGGYPALNLGAGDLGVYLEQSPDGEGIGLVVGTCCHQGTGGDCKLREDTVLATSGFGYRPGGTGSLVPAGLFVVADGEVTQHSGQIRSMSRLAAETIGLALLPALSDQLGWQQDHLGGCLIDGLERANERLRLGSTDSGDAQDDGGTTLTVALVAGGVAYIAKVGQGHAFLYRSGIGLLTVAEGDTQQPDDSTGTSTEEENGGETRRGLGCSPTVDAEFFAVDLKVGDLLLLCSNGLWSVVDQAFLEQTLQWFAASEVADPARLCTVLRETALQRGGNDHLSIIVVQVISVGIQPRAPSNAASSHASDLSAR